MTSNSTGTMSPKPQPEDAKAWRAEARRYRKQLVELSNVTYTALAQLDVLMKQPPSVERGKAIARVLNALAMANDSARHFGLGIPFDSPRWKRLAK